MARIPSCLDGIASFVWAHRVAASMALVMIAASTLRLANLGHNSLTHDECIRGNWSFHWNVDRIRFFPPGQFVVLWVTQHWLSRSEWVMRLPVALLGILAVYLCYSVTRHRLGPWAAVLAGTFLALNGHALFYSRCVKEIGYEPVLTLLLIWAGSRAAQTARQSHVVVFFALTVLGLLFGFSPIMVATAWGPWILWSCRRNAENDHRSLRLFLGLTAALIPLVLAWYVWVNGCSLRRIIIAYMGDVEHAWPASYSIGALASWLYTNSLGLLRFVTGVVTVWQPRGATLFVVCVFLMLAGIGELWRRWPTYVQFACTLLAVNIVLALANKWPFGDYRMSVFLLPVFAPLLGCGLACVLRRVRSWPAGVFLLLICFAGPALQAAQSTIVQPREYDHARPVVRAMRRNVQPGDAILVYYGATFSFEYYWSDSIAPADVTVHIQNLGSRGRFDLYQGEFDTLAEAHPRVWVFFTHVWGDEGKDWSAYATQGRQVVHTFRSVDAFAYCVETKKGSAS